MQNCYSVFYAIYANSENTLKVFYCSWRIREKYLIDFRECAWKYKENTAFFEWFSMSEIASEHAKSILTCTENTLNNSNV